MTVMAKQVRKKLSERMNKARIEVCIAIKTWLCRLFVLNKFYFVNKVDWKENTVIFPAGLIFMFCICGAKE